MIELSRYKFERLREDQEFVLNRGGGDGDLPRILVVAPVFEHPALGSLKRLEHEYSFLGELDPGWAVRPLALARYEGRIVLVLEDPGGEPFDRLLGQAMETTRFLRFAISLVGALGKLHQRGLIHKDIKPANIFMNSATGQIWLTGFRIASRLLRERQSSAPPEVIAGTLAYIAPEQTGRMNRSIDSRSDLYSLGVTLYETLTGTLPFTASDPLEWVHCHIARQPPAPAERMERIPEAISAIVMKLLAKTAEERYQTAAGLEADLRRCLVEWESRGQIEPFPLGKHDVPDRLLIPEKLYGRDWECQALLAAFDRVVASGIPELVLVSGYSGIGKSSVVNELHKAIVLPRGIFISGKFDQHKRDIPHATLAQAFQGLVRQILSKSEGEVSHWRDALLAAVGTNGQLVVNLIPELELIIGKQSPVPKLPPQEAQNRFDAVVRRFIGTFARKEHPLALFLDDLQWLDPASLKLLEQLVTHPDIRHLLLIGAYRDNEVTPCHPLQLTLDSIRKAETIVHKIVLKPLSLADVNQLLGDALRCEPAHAQPLAELVHEKTGGNPFFAIQFLTNLAEEHLLEFDAPEAAWRWDLNRLRAKGFTDNVVDLMVSKLKRLPTITQEALSQLACLGNSAEFTTLAIVHGGSEEEVHSDLWDAVLSESVLRIGDSYKFLHDRIQEAAYALIPQELRARVHLDIGRLLIAKMSSDEIAEKIFDTVNQLNSGLALIFDADEKDRVAELNLCAGRKAKGSTAYKSACLYLSAGMDLVGFGVWGRRYELAFGLWLERAECELLSANFGEAEGLISELLSKSRSKIDRAAAYQLKILLHLMQSNNPEAIRNGLECLNMFGIEIPAHPTNEEVQIEYEWVWRNLGERSIESLIHLPLMTDPEIHTTMEVLSIMSLSAYLTDSNLCQLVACHMVSVSLKNGTTDASAHGYMGFALFLGPVFHRYKDGHRFAMLAIDIVEKYNLSAWKADVYLLAEMVVLWTQPIKTAVDYLQAAFRAAIETGDVVFACYSLEHTVMDMLARGDNLEQVWLESVKGLDFARKAKFRQVADTLMSIQLFVQDMRGRNASLSTFDGANVDQQTLEAQLIEGRVPVVVCFYWILKLRTRFMMGDYQGAIEAAQMAKPLLWASQCHIQSADYYYYAALANAAIHQMGGPQRQADAFAMLKQSVEQLREWAENCPETFLDKYVLVSAEIARIEGRDLDAIRLYEEAIRAAREYGFVQDEAIANELAARFYENMRYQTIAEAYLRNARSCYLRWRALGKVEQLDQHFPAIREQSTLRPAALIGAPVDQLDLQTIMKMSQAVSGEIVLEKLIETLMRIAVEHAGAERGLLILRQGEENRVEAEARTGPDGVGVQLRLARPAPTELPESLLRFVIRTQQSAVLDDASSESLFSDDPYVLQKRLRSVLCLPLVKQTKLIGALYLENNLAPRVFTPKRLAMLELLASQAAISLDHARLYGEAKRAEEMQVAMAREREMFAQQRVAQLVKANAALRGLLDALALVPELDEFIGQVMAAITGQLGAVSSMLRVFNPEQKTMTVEMMFQDGRVMSPDEAKFPKHLCSLGLDEMEAASLDQPISVLLLGGPRAMTMPQGLRTYLLELGVRALLIIPLTSKGEVNGLLSFRFNEERNFDTEELEIARALATQASLAIQLTRLAKSARQSAVLEERNRLAAEIHDSLAQSFTGISMQLELALEEMAAKEGGLLGYIRHAHETAKFGLAEARRSAHSLRSSALRESGLVTVLQRLVEHSNLAGRLRCDFRFNRIPEESLPATVQHQLLRIAQEAISNAVRHAKPTVVTVTLRWDPPNLVLQVKDNGSGISKTRLEKCDGLGLDSMRERAAQIDAKLEIQTAAGHGTSIIVTVPMRVG